MNDIYSSQSSSEVSGSGGGNGSRQMVTFIIGDEEFGVDIGFVWEINRLMQITPVPNAPPAVEGVVNLRGEVVPVVDMRRQFKLPPRENSRETRVVVIEMDDTIAGFIVDSVSEVINLPQSAIEPPPAMVGGVESEYITGVGKVGERLLIVLNLKNLVVRASLAMELAALAE